jgi:hypothetical protein
LTFARQAEQAFSMTISLADVIDPEKLRRLAAHQLGRLEVNAAATSEQMVRTSGWLTAALFAINGGGALAALNVIERLDQPSWSADAFLGGITFAMLNAVLIQHFTSAITAPVESLLMFWTEVEAIGAAPSDYEEIVKPIKRLEPWHWTAPAAGWISGVLFLCGAVILGIDIASPPQTLMRRCAMLQQDMVKLSPVYADSRELFEALKCTPR